MAAFRDILTIPWLGITFHKRTFLHKGFVYEGVCIKNTSYNYMMIDWEDGVVYLSEDPPSEGEFDLSRWNQWLDNAETINIRVLVRG